MYSIAKAVRRANPVMTSVIALSSVFLFGGEQAKAQCVPSGSNTVTCTGSIPSSIDLATSAYGGTNTLNVTSILSDTKRIWLQGTGVSVADGVNEIGTFNCLVTGTASGGSTEAKCTINNVVQPPTCSANNGDQGQTATCNPVITIPGTSGPTGKSGPSVTIAVDTPTSGPFTIGGGRTDIAVFGLSRGSKGGKGGDRCCAGDGHDGGDGVDGGTVLINFAGIIPNSDAGGIVAQSIGGDGGNGGHAGTLGGNGGSGGKGGFGGTAVVSFNGGAITTSGEGNVGITALSQGGNGGDGGKGGFFVSGGGDGESAGQAGTALVTTLAGTTISTSGDYAFGIAGYSLGGGGGTGSGGFGLFYSGGGSGSTGGNGGTVTINAASLITTTGEYAHGILAQSIGGGGGSAGTTAGIVALGGDGAAGGMGGTVTLNNSGLITTYGLGANAIEAQSIGGGGGNGANSAGGFALGGKGAGTTKGGSVSVTNSGVLKTYSSDATGILAQSIGGGGGDGGSAGGLFSYGGSGGTGADGGTVTVTNSGDIVTGLAGGTSGSAGIVAQSIGGGGGNGGGAVSASPTFAAAFGGRGAMAGAGSNVFVLLDNTDASQATSYDIATHGDASSAIIAQSIGGGGGNGGFAVAVSASQAFSVALGVGGNGAAGGDAGVVYVKTKGSLFTQGLSSDGIMAQSIGGGGGNGGFSVAASVSMGASVALSLGGDGGTGGNASGVTVSSLSDITTFGGNSYGILAQSLGGGGGNGGFSVAASGGVAGVSIGIGGDGDHGGSAGTVDVLGLGDIITLGNNAGGIAAQSIGGGGGNGGFAATGTLSLAGAGVSVGGGGNAGGVSDAVSVDNSGVVFTSGKNSIGILAQSLGGGGGNGGFAASATITLAGSASVGVGGSGGDGQHAGTASIYADGGTNSLPVTGYDGVWNLVTQGNNSAGIEAQSIGGGGGNGGFSGTLALSSGNTLGLSLGGSGGDGAYASSVLIRSGYGRSYANNIFTAGANSAGIVAQSIGGGGGNGGFAVSLTGSIQGGSSLAVTLGGSGGDGGIGAKAKAYSVGNITTLGKRSDGVLVQSIGGGGGNGGFSVAASIATVGYTEAVAIGGSGGTGNDADTAVLNSAGAIAIYGEQSNGLIAQSIGGGGGNGGFAGAGTISFSGIGVAVGVGGSGHGGGNASTVELTNTGAVTTYGDQSSAIIAQSLGGGGGNGGSTVGLALGALGGASVVIGGKADGGGNSGKVGVTSVGNLTTGVGSAAGTLGNSAYGILAQSLGGGGGNGGFAGSLSAGGAVGIGVSVGGQGGGGGSAGIVQVTNTGNIATVFDESGGILAQSVGGGGGNGGFTVALSGSATIEDIPGGSAAVAVGGKGGTAGLSSNVSVTSTGTILTYGFNSDGIAAQSIGGGGGNGGFSVAGSATLGQAGIDVSVGGFGGGGGNAAKASVYSYSAGYQLTSASDVVTIETVGGQSNGILAQSLGGGGGNGGFSVGVSAAADGAAIGVSVGGFGAGAGSADEVWISSYNNILTRGFESNAIAAQSIGGGGGNGGFAAQAALGSKFAGAVAVGGFALGGGGKGGVVHVDSHGLLSTLGDESNGILAQSIGGGGGNGGFALSGAFTTGSAGLNASIGGKGAHGGDSAAVSVSSYGAGSGVTPTYGVITIATDGIQSNGILAQSIGGGGGNGGFAAGASLVTDGMAFGVSVGGFGDGGGAADAVGVTSYNNIATAGYQSNAIMAQSLGGGGGNGGFVLEATAGSKFAGSIAVGGFALSGGGSAGRVTVDSFGTLVTEGDEANGLLAQSIGGGGGNGGFALSGAFTMGQAGLTASIGGKGSNGGRGANVIVTSNVGAAWADNIATIYTSGESANGIEAQSIGGGGGNGGFSGGFTATAGAKATMSLSVGGFGAAGNSAGSVDVTSIDNIVTEGNGSNAIIAQSIGGGGGDGGFSFAGTLSIPSGNSLSLSASLGGFGGSAGNAGSVSLASNGFINTAGDHANGVVAQSLGGGGGNGGISVAGAFNFAPENNLPSITASVGGKGGAGGAASAVDVTRVGMTTTTGEQAVGILAQSIGGGGGNGGLSVAGSIGGPDAKQISASVGGWGGAGSEAGNVTVRNTGAITTGKIAMEQIQLAQPGQVFKAIPVEYGYASHGILAQSIGGGGGNGGFAFSGSVGPTGEGTSLQVGLTVGGFGGSGGYAGNVDVASNGLITTYGAASFGVAAQSIGGGGGNGGSALTGQIAAGDPQSGAKTIQVAISVGGMGGDGNIAGDVVVDQKGGIVTYGDQSYGILAQSVGGGGGNGGGANTLSLQLATSCTFTIPKAPQIGECKDPKARSVNVQADVGGFGGTGNDAGTVTVTNHDFITTSGSAAAGILAQSIGGGGGNGGQAVIGLGEMFQGASYVDIGTTVATLPIGLTGAATGFGKVTVGGFGGAAGDGDTVVVNNEGAIHTAGDSAYGISAQSVGGGGGNGGNAASGVTGLVSVGGFGAASGKGGSVTVTNTLGADIITTGYWSDAILAQSIGGGGGNGGAAGALVALGGFGGASGSGGTVEVDNAANLRTSAWFSTGIVAQSIGGGGGNGGGTGLSGIAVGGMAGVLGSTGDGGAVTVRNANAATILTAGMFANGIMAQSIGGGGGNGGGSTLAAAVTVGGVGGNSGSGGHVQIFNDGQIETDGFFSFGVFAQSIGGSGGNGGGSNVSAVNVGGFGGSSGNGGEVDVVNTNLIHTLGFGSDAVRAQSIGGGGGNAGGVADSITSGGLSAALVDIGGGGGAAGDGGVVDIVNSGYLLTDGLAAAGISAQSIGGGGGDGGRAIGIESIGGFGGAAGDGGAVSVTNNIGGVIWTKGLISDGIFAQSVGGGGGNGGGAFSGSPVGISESVGGNGAGGGDGGSVLVNNYALVQTDGFASTAIFVQSVGGGGGNGGFAGSYNAQMISGGLPAVGVSVGGSGGIGGNGGSVTVNNNAGGSIISNGASSTAIFAQSVGGGGGKGGYAMTSSTSLLGSVAVSLGGSGGAGGNGDAVSVTNAGAIVINGKNSVAIMAQSVGGGGGIAAASTGTATVPVTIGGQTGANGTGGDVSVVNTGSITINGNNSVGIFAQSVGGGGGMVLPGGGVTSVEKATGGTGDGGTVTIDNTAGSIVINGENSIAMYMQSVGGGGGAVGLDADPPGQIGAFLFSGTSGGSGAALATKIDQSGNLIATGFNSIALVAQSSAAGGVGDITVDILNPSGSRSLIIGGSGQGAGVEILDGADNILNNAGVIGATSTAITGIVTGFSADDGTFAVAGGRAVSGTAGYGIVTSGTANTTINNTGVINGSIDLGTAGINTFFNAAGATFNPGAVVILGSGTLTNAGMLAPGGFNNVSTTAITGHLVQSATSTLGVDLDLQTAATDRITLNGTAALSGVVRANLTNPLVAPGYAVPGTHAPVILTATGEMTHASLTLQAFNTVVAHYALVYPTAQSIGLQYTIDYNPAGLTANQQTMGALVNTIQTAQNTPGFRPIATNLFYLPGVAALGAAYDSLSGEGEAAVQQAAFDDNAQFMAILGNQVRDWMSGAPRAANHEAVRLWMSSYGSGAIRGGDAATGSAKVRQSAYGIAGGFDAQLVPSTLVGLAISGGTSWFNVPDRATKGSLDTLHLGLYGAWHEENAYVSGAFSYDIFQNYETRQAVVPSVTLPASLFVDGPYTVPGYNENPSAQFGSTALSGHFEAGYHVDLDPIRITPFVGLEFGSLKTEGFSEANGLLASAAGLSFAPQRTTSLPSLLGVQFDTQSDLGNGESLRAWVRATWKHEFDITRMAKSSFIAAPGFEFRAYGAEPARDAALADAGLKLDLDSAVAIYTNFSGAFGGRSQGYSGTAGISLKW